MPRGNKRKLKETPDDQTQPKVGKFDKTEKKTTKPPKPNAGNAPQKSTAKKDSKNQPVQKQNPLSGEPGRRLQAGRPGPASIRCSGTCVGYPFVVLP